MLILVLVVVLLGLGVSWSFGLSGMLAIVFAAKWTKFKTKMWMKIFHIWSREVKLTFTPHSFPTWNWIANMWFASLESFAIHLYLNACDIQFEWRVLLFFLFDLLKKQPDLLLKSLPFSICSQSIHVPPSEQTRNIYKLYHSIRSDPHPILF